MILSGFKGVEKKYPSSKITLVCNLESALLIKNFKVVDKIIPILVPWTDWDFTLVKFLK